MQYRSIRIINVMAAMISLADALTTGLMAVSERRWIESLDSNRTDIAIMWIQLIVLCGEFSE